MMIALLILLDILLALIGFFLFLVDAAIGGLSEDLNRLLKRLNISDDDTNE